MHFHSSVRSLLRALAGAVLAAGLLLAPLAAPAVAEDAKPAKSEEIKRVPILWEVQTKPKIYLFGTIHVTDPRVLAHPPVVKKALENSQALYTELDFGKLNPIEMAKYIRIPGGKMLGDIAPKSLMEKFEKVVTRYELGPMQKMQFQAIKPWMSATQLALLVNTKRAAEKAAADAAKAGADEAPAAAPAAPQQPLDLLLYAGAKSAGKLVGGLETVHEQLSIFDGISMPKQLQMLEQALEGILKLDEASAKGEGKGGEGAVDEVEHLIRMYLRGNVDTFYEYMQKSMGEDPEMKGFMAELLDKRNIIMVRRMMEAGEKHPDKTMFVAVGSGHYPGKLGIIQLLRDTGFRVRPLHSLADMEKPWPKVGAKETSSRARPRRRMRRVGPFCFPCCPR